MRVIEPLSHENQTTHNPFQHVFKELFPWEEGCAAELQLIKQLCLPDINLRIGREFALQALH